MLALRRRSTNDAIASVLSYRDECAPPRAPLPILPDSTPAHASPLPRMHPSEMLPAPPANSSPRPRIRIKPIRVKSWALKTLTEAVRKLIYRKFAKCAPEVFRANCPQRPEQRPAAAGYGHIQFSGGGVKLPAHWMHLADSRAPYRTSKR